MNSNYVGNLVKLNTRSSLTVEVDTFRDSISSLAEELVNGLPYSSFLLNSKNLAGEEVITHYRILPLKSPSGKVLHFLVILEFVR